MLQLLGAERSYKKRRRGGSENIDLEDRLESLILKVGDKVIFKLYHLTHKADILKKNT